jgi:hypothetical protein
MKKDDIKTKLINFIDVQEKFTIKKRQLVLIAKFLDLWVKINWRIEPKNELSENRKFHGNIWQDKSDWGHNQYYMSQTWIDQKCDFSMLLNEFLAKHLSRLILECVNPSLEMERNEL